MGDALNPRESSLDSCGHLNNLAASELLMTMNKALLTAIACLGLLAAADLRAADTARTLDIYWIDSEGGGSTLIVTPSGESILVDSGNPGGRDPSRIHKIASQVAGLKKIDHLVTTHFDIDHFGGAAELSELMPIGQVYDNGSSAERPQQPAG